MKTHVKLAFFLSAYVMDATSTLAQQPYPKPLPEVQYRLVLPSAPKEPELKINPINDTYKKSHIDLRVLGNGKYPQAIISDITFSVNLKLDVMGGEPSEITRFKYEFGDKCRIEFEGKKGQSGITLVREPFFAENRVDYLGFVNSNHIYHISANLFDKLDFVDPWLIVRLAHGDFYGHSEMYFIRKNPGVMAKSGKWGWDVKGIGKWEDLFHWSYFKASAPNNHTVPIDLKPNESKGSKQDIRLSPEFAKRYLKQYGDKEQKDREKYTHLQVHAIEIQYTDVLEKVLAIASGKAPPPAVNGRINRGIDDAIGELQKK